MSVPTKHTTWGNLLYGGRKYGVLYAPLSDQIIEKINSYVSENNLATYTSAPWMHQKNWRIENGKLYLTKLYTEKFHREIFGNNESVFADWMDEVKLLINHRLICKTYEKKGTYLNEVEVLRLVFDDGLLENEYRETELYRSIEMKNYIDCFKRYTTLRIDSTDLLDYLMEHNAPKEDKVYPMVSKFFIERMIQPGGGEEVVLDLEDVKRILKEGDMAVFASAQGSNIDEMVGSLSRSMTDEVLKAKGCLVHITMHKAYPMGNIKKLIDVFGSKLAMSGDAPFIFGVSIEGGMGEDEVLIQVLLCV